MRRDASLGLKTALTVTATNDVLLATTSTLDVIFTVITSPDSNSAAMWGHMPDTLSVDSITLHRPLLYRESPEQRTRGRIIMNHGPVSILEILVLAMI